MTDKLPELLTGWDVDQSIVTEEDRIVVIRWGAHDDIDCIQVDKNLRKIQNLVRNFAVIYTVDCVNTLTDFNIMYELTDHVTLMFFYRNRHIQVDIGTGDNNKITTPTITKDQLIDIIEEVYLAAKKGRGLVTSQHDFSSGVKW